MAPTARDTPLETAYNFRTQHRVSNLRFTRQQLHRCE
jgi:hypothetical protein